MVKRNEEKETLPGQIHSFKDSENGEEHAAVLPSTLRSKVISLPYGMVLLGNLENL